MSKTVFHSDSEAGRDRGMRLRICCQVIGFLGVILTMLSHPPVIEAKAWLNGHIVELRPDGFVLRTRFYPRITVHLSQETKARCKKHVLKVDELEADDLVTVEGHDKGGVIEATKITIHRDWLKCGEIKGPKPAHCQC
jgi:hypothetical protein